MEEVALNAEDEQCVRACMSYRGRWSRGVFFPVWLASSATHLVLDTVWLASELGNSTHWLMFI